MKLVFLHGAGSSSLSFYYQLRHFRNSKAIDLPGHSTGKACHDIDSYLEWVRGFITARRYKDVVLCGHAMGGAIALQYALRYPEELKGLILMGTGARRPAARTSRLSRAVPPTWPRQLQVAGQIYEVIQGCGHGHASSLVPKGCGAWPRGRIKRSFGL